MGRKKSLPKTVPQKTPWNFTMLQRRGLKEIPLQQGHPELINIPKKRGTDFKQHDFSISVALYGPLYKK